MKKLLIMIDSLRCGGAEKSLISLLPFLAERDYDITLMVMKKGGLFEKYVPDKIRIERFPFSPSKLHQILYSVSLRLPWNKRKHGAELYWETIGKYYPSLNEKYDVAIAYQQGFPTFYIAEKVNTEKKICWINADIKAAGYSEKFCKRFYKKYNTVVAVSDILKEKIVFPDYVENQSKILTVWDILNESLIRSMADNQLQSYNDKRKIHLTTVGRLAAPKGYDLAISAARILKEKGINFLWHFVGGGPLAETLKNQIAEQDVSDCVVLEGEQLNPYPFMRNADIYVQTSKFEGFGMTIGEAKILGRPIVSTNFPVVYNQITDGKNGIVVEMTPESISEGIQRLINDTDLRKKFMDAVASEHNTTAETESAKVINLIES